MTEEESLDVLYAEGEESLTEVVPFQEGDALSVALVEMREIRTWKSEMAADEKIKNARYEELQQRVVATFEARGVTGMKMPGVGHFILNITSYPTVLNEEPFYEWLEERGEDGIIKRKINHNTFKSWWKETLEGGGELPPDTLAKAFDKKSITVRKA